MCDTLIGAIAAARGGVSNVELAVFPPSVFVEACVTRAGGHDISVGAQNVSEHDQGAYTGELSVAMVREVGAEMALCGHSERRQYFGETNAAVAAKAKAVIDGGLTAVVCVGETLEEREVGTTEAVVAEQLSAVLALLSDQDLERMIVAYEPVWAIGTGKTASPEQAQDVHAFLRSKIAERDATMAGRMRILYGGSVKGANADALFACEDIDGGLIGGASLKAEDFLAICEAGERRMKA